MDLLSTRTPMPLTQPVEEKQQPVGAKLLDNYVRNADHYEAEDVTPEFLAKHTYAKEGAASGLDFVSWSKQNGVTDFLTNAQTTVAKKREQAAWDAAQPETRGFLAGTGAALGRGAMDVVGSMGHTLALADATPNAIDTDKGILDRAGEGMTKWAEDKKEKTQFMRPTMQEEAGETGAVKKAWEGGVESMVTSTAPMAAGFVGMKAGGALGAPLGPAGIAVGGTIGGLAAYGLARFGMFGAGVYGDTYDKTYAELKQKNPGMGEDEVRRIANKGAWTDAISENVSEAVGDAAAFYTFGGSKVLQQPLRATIKDVMKRGLKGYATDVAKQMPFEVGSEMANAAVGANWRQEAGLQGGDMAEAAKEAIGPAVVMSLLMGGGVAGYTEVKARKALANINGADADVRARTANEIALQIKERTGEEDLAESWRQHAFERIGRGEEIELDEQLMKFGANRARIDAADAGQDIPVVTDETEQEQVRAAEPVTPAESLLTGGVKQRPEDVLLGTDPIIPEPFNPAAQSPVIEQQRQAFDAAYAQGGGVQPEEQPMDAAEQMQASPTAQVTAQDEGITADQWEQRNADTLFDLQAQQRREGLRAAEAEKRKQIANLERLGNKISPTQQQNLTKHRDALALIESDLSDLDRQGMTGMADEAEARGVEEFAPATIRTELDAVAHEAATSPLNDLPEPTQAQKEAGNYKKAHVRMSGLDISIENPKGSKRKGVDEDGRAWETEMRSHYGYIKGSIGADNDHVDVFIGDKPDEQRAFVVDQVNPKTGKFDEHKVVLGAATEQEARELYLSNYDDGWQGLGAISEMSMQGFRKWVFSKKTKRPVAEMTAKLEAEGLEFHDPGTDQLGRVDGKMMVLDPGAVRKAKPTGVQQQQAEASATTESGLSQFYPERTPLDNQIEKILSLKGVTRRTNEIHHVPSKLMTPARLDKLLTERERKYSYDPRGTGSYQIKRFGDITGDWKSAEATDWAIIDQRERYAERKANEVKHAEASKKEPWQMTRGNYYQSVRDNEGAGKSNARAWPNWSEIKKIVGFDFFANGNEVQPLEKQRLSGGFSAEQEAAIKDALSAQGFTVDKTRVRNNEERDIPKGGGWRARSKDVLPTSPEHERAVRKALSDGKPVPAEVLAEYPDLAPQNVEQPGAKTFETAQEGDIYEAEIGGRKRFLIRGNNPRGGGDSIHDTFEQAIAYKEERTRIDKANAETSERNKKKEDEQSATAASDKAKYEDVKGYTDSMTPLARGLTLKRLNSPVRHNGQVMTRKELVEKLIAEGADIETRQENKIKDMSRRQWNRATQKEQDDHKRKQAAAGKVTVHSIGNFDVSKTEYEYAKHLLVQDAPVKKLEAEQAAAPAEQAPTTPDLTVSDKRRDVPGHPDYWYVVSKNKHDGWFNVRIGSRTDNTFQSVYGTAEKAEWAYDRAISVLKRHTTGIDAVVDHFAKKLYSGAKYTNIVQARKEAAEVMGEDVKSGTDMAKMVDEAIELAVVKTARKMIREMRGKGATDLEIYQDLVALYAQQPTLGTRTSTSVAQQAYSTPVPIAFLASRLAGIKANTRVLEPTAGNGMLLLEADHPVVNELNPDRAARLRSLGFKVGEMDAASEEFVTKVSHHVDAVVANPPFGRVYDENGEAKSWTVAGYETKELDHAIVLRSLELLLPDGKSALIIGGKQGEGKNRSLKYHAVAQRQFYKALFDNFKVVDHFTIDGKLYAKQGAGFPIDIIVIDGRGKTEGRKFPAADPPRIYDSFEALEDLFNEKSMGSKVEVTGDDAGFSDGMDGDRKQGEPAVTGGDTASGADTTGGRTETGNQELSGDTGKRGADRPVRRPGRTGKGQQGGDLQSAGQAGTGAQTGRDGRGREEGLPAQAEQPDAGLVRGDDATRVGGRGGDGISLDALMGEWDRQEEASKQKQQSEKKPTTEKTAAERMAESAESLNKNLQAALDVFSQFGGLSVKVVKEGDPVNQTLYEAIRPHLLAAYKDLKNMGLAGADLIREFVAKARAVFGDKSAQARPYFEKFAGEIVEMERATEKRDEKPATPPAQKKEEAAQSGTELQDPYVPRSKSSKMGTLVPKNMTAPLKNALNRLEAERGDIDEYVAKELGYSKKELEEYFAGEQIDAIALAINNIDKGAGFIIGDQTGIGKGRVNAAIMRYAKRKNMVPVFVTMKPDLYADMVRDLQDIGMAGFNPLPTNAGLTGDKAIPLPDGRTLRTASAAKHSTVLESQGKSFVDGYDAVFTTYSQLQSVKGADTARREFIRRIAPKAVFILDESHNAGGSESQARKKKDAQPNTADFIRAVLGMTENGVFYSSATYAKRPDVMSLYFKTDMRHAVDDISSLASAISAGGIPLQQIVAAQLTESGQYIRRERSFEGASVDVAPAKADMKAAEQSATIMRSILAFDKIKQKALSDLNDSAMGEGEGVGDSGATGEKGASSTNFTSVMHNLIGQSLLAMKADAAVEEAIAARKRGEKPIITLANTMGSFIAEHVAAEEISLGQEITLSFKDLYRRYLEKTRTLTRRDSRGKIIEQRVLTDEELGPEGVAAYNASLAEIEQSNFGDLPISPIDYITSKLNAAGISVGEITGRTAAVDYSDGIPVYRSRRPSPAANIETMRSFNSGQTDAIILNQSGSTGISLHSSSTFADTSKRTMIIVQPELNIDVFMQTLGRVFRTGQVVPPAYKLLTSDLPAEKRPAAILAKKLAGLNANTTASRKTDTTFQNIPDFLNDYGDLVTALIMEENPEIHRALGSPLKEGDVGYEREGDVRKVTGRIPLLPLKEQQELYDMIEGEYNDLLAQLEATGASNLEAKTLKLDAKLISSSDLTTAKDVGGNSPFAAESKVGLFDVKSLGKPYSPDQVRKLIEQGQANKPDIEKTREDTIAWLEKRLESVKDAAAKTDLELRVGQQYASVQTILSKYEIGSPVLVSTMGNTYTGIITRIDHKGSGNPSAPSSWKMTVAIADAARQIVVPFSKIQTDMGLQDALTGMRLGQVMVKNSSKSLNTVLDEFARGQTTSREKRFIAYGNVLAAYSAVRNEGQIVNFEDSDGNIRAGIMFKKNATLSEIVGAADVSVPDYESMVKFFDRTRDNGMLSSSDKNLKISRQGGYWTFLTPASKAKGAQFFLNGKLVEAAGRDFVKSGNSMKVTANADTAAKMINVLREQGFGIIAASHASEAREVMGLDNNEESGASNPQYSIAPTTPSPVDLRAAFPWADSITEQDGRTIITKGKVSFTVEQVESIKPDEMSFKLAYGRKPGAQDQIAGQYQNGTITLSKMADKWTVQHEFEHFLEDMGLITTFEQAVLNSAIKRAERDGTLGFDAAPNGKRMKDAELRAYYIQNALAKRDFDRKTTLGRVLQKIADFIDALANLFVRTSRGVVRDVASGKMMGRESLRADVMEGVRGFQTKGVTETEAFKRWSGGAPVLDDALSYSGNGPVVLKLVHGSPSGEIDAFKKKFGGIYFTTDREFSDEVFTAQNEYGGKTYEVFVKADRPFDARWKNMGEKEKSLLRKVVDNVFDSDDIDAIREKTENSEWEPFESFTDGELWADAGRQFQDKVISEINRLGFDLVIFQDNPAYGVDHISFVAFEPKQIKSVDNSGAFDPADARIQYALAPTLQKVKELKDDILSRPEVVGRLNFINTQLHKALKHSGFRRIFDRFHAAAGTQQRAAARSASLAPDILPDHSGGFKQSVRELLTKTSEFSAADLRHVSTVLSMETLAGKNPSPFAGHRLTDVNRRDFATDAEYQAALNNTEVGKLLNGETVKVGDNDVRMNGKQVRLYRQARASLDQMLREMGTSEAWRIIRGVLTTHQSTAGDFDAKDYWEVFANNPLEAAGAMKSLLERETVKAEARLTRATQDLLVLTGAEDMDGAKEWGKQLVTLNKAIDNVGKFSKKQLEDDDLDELVAKREKRIDRLAEELGISADEADATLKEYKGMVKEHTAATTHVENVKGATKSIGDVFAKTDQLIKSGYMPLSRFGQYRIDVRDDDGNLLHASFYDTSTEANQERRKLVRAFGQTGIVGEVETVSQEDWKLYQGQNPEALRLFAEAAGAESDEAIQAYYQDAISSRSALKRLINRQGYAGYSDDLQRILASFITSGSKRIGQNYHAADISDMVKDKNLPGDLRDEAIRLKSFIENPGDAGSSFRAFAANWYMLGSLMSAAWNGTQVVTSSLPELYKHSGSVGRSTKDVFGAYRSMIRKGADLTQTEKQALARAQEDGTVDAAEIHHLYAQATKRFINKLGNGEAAKKVGAFLRLWGMPFSWFETVNRKATFLAAYRMAERQGVDDPYALARSIVDVSQGIYSKHNRPNVARSAVGGAVLTFMQYKIMTLEQIARNAKEGGQARKAAALQLAIIAAMGGWKALPGIDDITDLYDIIAQVIFGQAVLSKKSMREAVEKGSKDAAGFVLEKDAADAVGKFFADAVNSGIVTAALPVDVSNRASMGALVPGLKLLKPSVQYRDNIVFDMAGVPGSMIDSLIDASGMMLRGNMGGASMRLAPNAVAAAAKGLDILATGEIKNTRGKKITDGDMVDGALQTIGAQPKAKSRINSRLYENQELKHLAQQEEKSIVGQWADAYDARGIDARNSAIQAARQRIVDWNRRNPEWPIAIKQTQVLNELKSRKKTTVELATKTAPKELRPSMAVQ